MTIAPPVVRVKTKLPNDEIKQNGYVMINLNQPQSRRNADVVSIADVLQNKSNQKTNATTNAPTNEPTERYFFPTLNDAAMGLTLEAYRLLVASINKPIEEKNKEIRAHNASVAENRKNLNDVQKAFLPLFLQKTAQDYKLNPKRYNEQARPFIESYGPIVPLAYEDKKIKPSTLNVFQEVLHAYQVQLGRHTNVWQKFNISYAKNLPELKLTASQLKNHRRNGEKSLDFTKKTISNHIQILLDKGILLRGEYGKNYRINPDILFIFEAENEILTSPENQTFIPLKWKILQTSKNRTRTLIKKEVKKTEIGKPDFEKRTASPDLGTRTDKNAHRSSEFQAPRGGGGENIEEKNVKVSAPEPPKDLTLSEKLTKTIIHPVELAHQLARGDHWNYQPYDFRVLQHEAYHGTMTSLEFQQFAVAETLKYLSKILYKNNQKIVVAEWIRTVKREMKTMYMNFNDLPFQKYLLIEEMQKYFWCIRYAQRWFNDKTFKPLYPFAYLDRTRTHRKEIGFRYTFKAYENHLKEVAKRKDQDARKAAKQDKARKNAVNQALMVERKVKSYLYDKISLEKLDMIVSKNYPNFSEKLPEMIEKLRIQYKK